MLFNIRTTHVEDLYPLRHRVLRPHQSIEDCKYPGDFDDETKHWVAVNDQGNVVGIVSLYKEHKDLGPSMAHWRLRGMATDESVRGQKLGQKLLLTCVLYVNQQADNGLWCNARVTACGFYEKNGFKKYGNEFEIEAIGPHFVMGIF